MRDPLKVFVGYDPREDEAYQVCRHSILARATVPVLVEPLVQERLRLMGLYWRTTDAEGNDWIDHRPFGTEFAFSRFLVPYLCHYRGWALFVDCDFLFRADIASLFALRDEAAAVMCVHHNHRPKEKTKMDGVPQEIYPMKNWSSLVLWNCGHDDNLDLGPREVNTRPGRWLHGFKWLRDTWKIVAIPETWNWLEGFSSPDLEPLAVHFTRGGPWHEQWKTVAFADEWLAERAKV